MAVPCTCPGGQHDGRFPYCSGTSGGPIVIERGGTDWAQIIDPRDARVAALEAQVARLEALIVEAAGWNVMDDPLHNEADRIRSRKP